MNRIEIETRALHELHALPLEKASEALDFILFLRARSEPHATPVKNRPLGILKDRASCMIAPDFAISDDDLLRS